ncbi:MAG: metal-dependent hydrolase [Pacificimonas sp.]
MSHAALPIAARLGLGKDVVPRRLLAAGMALAMLPDADVVGFAFGVDYADNLGHRGLTHSLLFAAIAALPVSLLLRTRSRAFAWAYLFFCGASHGLLDIFTDGGLGVALLWPFDDSRLFASVRPIAVSPIGISAFLSARGWQVLLSELAWIWSPFMSVGLLIMVARRRARE